MECQQTRGKTILNLLNTGRVANLKLGNVTARDFMVFVEAIKMDEYS